MATVPTLKRKGGRRKFTRFDLLPNWEEVAIDCGSQGMSDIEIRKNLAIAKYRVLCTETWESLLKDEFFAEVIKRARILCQAWWEEQGRKGLKAQHFNSALWFMNMKNRFKWRDKQPEEVAHAINNTTISDPQQILDIIDRFGKKTD